MLCVQGSLFIRGQSMKLVPLLALCLQAQSQQMFTNIYDTIWRHLDRYEDIFFKV